MPVLRFRVSERGWFTDLDGMLRLEIPLHAFRRIPVRVDAGDILILRAPDLGGSGPESVLPELDVQTRHGHVAICPQP